MMPNSERLHMLRDMLPDAVREIGNEGTGPYLHVNREKAADFFDLLKTNPACRYEHLSCMSALDMRDSFELIYHFQSREHPELLALKVTLPRNEPAATSIVRLWKSAEWYEREIFDMFGIRFEGHPGLTRLLCPQDWEGYPLRKDYRPPELYHGIRVSHPGGGNA